VGCQCHRTPQSLYISGSHLEESHVAVTMADGKLVDRAHTKESPDLATPYSRHAEYHQFKIARVPVAKRTIEALSQEHERTKARTI
jgi:hypothetical protein